MSTKTQTTARAQRRERHRITFGSTAKVVVPRSERSTDELSHYLEAMCQVPLLTKAEELALAREIEEREIEHWGALMSYRPAIEHVALAADAALPRRAPKLNALASGARRRPTLTSAKARRRWQRAVDAAARELRERDTKRNALREVDRAIRAVRRDARARAYLARVARARRAQEAAKARFVAANLRLVVSLSARCNGTGLSRADLIQEGNLGLMKAVDRFDHRRGFRFSTYATWWIRHYMNRAVSDKAALIRVPVHAQDTQARVSRLTQRTLAETGRPPSTDELAGELNVDERALELVKDVRLLNQTRSLDQPVSDGSHLTLHDLLRDPGLEHPDDTSDRAADRRRLLRAMRKLTSMEAAIVRFRFGFDGSDELTLREVGEKYNLSRERIRQLQERALAKLRHALTRDADAA